MSVVTPTVTRASIKGMNDMTETDCTTCGQHFHLSDLGWATPGYTRQIRPTIYNERGGVIQEGSAVWVGQGPRVIITRRPDEGGLTWTLEWPCGDHAATFEEDAYDIVNCSCAANRQHHFDRRRQTCRCCHGARHHRIQRDGSTPTPTCAAFRMASVAQEDTSEDTSAPLTPAAA